MTQKAPSPTTANSNVGRGRGNNQNKNEGKTMTPGIYFGIALLVVRYSMLFGGIALLRYGWIETVVGVVLLIALLVIELDPYAMRRPKLNKPRVLPPSTLVRTKLHYEDLKH